VLGNRRAKLRIVLREPRAPFGVSDDRGTELRVGGQPRLVSGLREQGDETQSLLGCDREPDVLVEHVLIPAVRFGVFGWAAHHLAPPCRRVGAMLGADGSAEHAADEVVLFHEVIEEVQPPLERVSAATPVKDRRRLVRRRRTCPGR
jgi:hypothetical protein